MHDEPVDHLEMLAQGADPEQFMGQDRESGISLISRQTHARHPPHVRELDFDEKIVEIR